MCPNVSNELVLSADGGARFFGGPFLDPKSADLVLFLAEFKIILNQFKFIFNSFLIGLKLEIEPITSTNPTQFARL